MAVNIEIFDEAGRLTRQREILPDDSHPFGFYQPRFGCKTNLPRVALIGCQPNDTAGYVYTLDFEEVQIADRSIVVPRSVLADKEPEIFRMGVPYNLTMETAQSGGEARFLVASHADGWAAGVEGAIPVAVSQPQT